MIVVHHLERSRSQRVLWLLEELGLDYEIRVYPRDPKTMTGAGRAAGGASARQVAGGQSTGTRRSPNPARSSNTLLDTYGGRGGSSRRRARPIACATSISCITPRAR